MNFYAVKKGRKIGIFNTWEEIVPLVNKYPGALFQKFATHEEAEKFIRNNENLTISAKQRKISKYITKKTDDSKADSHLMTIKKLIKLKNDPNGEIHAKSAIDNDVLVSPRMEPAIQSAIQFAIESNIESKEHIPDVELQTNGNANMIIKKQQILDMINTEKEIQNVLVKEDKQMINAGKKIESINVYCDGSTFNNGSKYAAGGIGISFGKDDPKNVSEPFLLDIPTNQRTELYALIRTLEILEKMIENYRENEFQFHIYTDSQYTINCVTKWLPSWAKNNWIKADGRKVKNVQLLKQLDKIYNRYRRQYQIHHIKAHGKSTGPHADGNNHADILAKQGSHQHPNYKKKYGNPI